ncbi:MAG: tetratricopeptide repeat protein [Vicinamibacterales bacterium]
MAIDREAALKRAEKSLRQGKLEGAIEEYVRLVQEQPRDWASINALGDLYVRAGDSDRAVEQFTRVADFLFEEGFLPKAQAVYKKALRVHSTHDHTLLRLAEIATRQGVFVDARQHLRQLADQRRFKGDSRGVAECTVKLGLLEDADPAAKLAAAQAADQLGETALVDRLLSDPALALNLTLEDLQAGRHDEAIRRIMRVVMDAPERTPDIVRLVDQLLEAGDVGGAFACLEVVVDAALLEGDLRRAADQLRTFVARVPHIPALTKLVDVCVDGGFENDMREAQAQLADAYQREGRAAEAKVILDDLSGGGDLVIDEDFFANLGTPQGSALLETAPDPAPTPVVDVAAPDVVEPIEIDLSETLTAFEPAPPLESVFAQLRERADREQQGDEASQQFEAAMAHLQAGRREEAIAGFRAVARVPAWRFKAGAQLGRLYLAAGEAAPGIEWLERAAEAPAGSPEEGAKLLYDLAGALESVGESARALAVLLELNADLPGYRDVTLRIDRLSRAQAGSAQP